VRLHRLRLKDFRGTDERELVLPLSGVVVVEGANEVGKTSLLEALDLLLTEKDSSTKNAVRAVKPVGRDVGSEVEAEISTGPYRFTYRKRWHRSTETVLTVHTPRREQLTGVPAHERVRSMLAETLDDGLWKALRMMQAAPLSQVPLGGSGALTAALDAAAGAVHDGGRSDSLVDAVEREYLRWHTATGRATGPLREAQEALAEARTCADEAERAMAEAARDVDRHAVLSAQITALDAERGEAAREVDRLAARWAAVEEVRRQADDARRVAADARREHEDALHARDVRANVAAEETRRAESVSSLTAAVDVQAEVVQTTAALLADHDRRRAELEVAAAEAAMAADAAQAAADRLQDVAELARLERRLERLELLAARAEEAERLVAAAGVDAAALWAVEDASTSVDLALARQSGAAARLVLQPGSDLRVTLDGAPVDLVAGERTEVPVAEPVEVVLPDLRLTVLPGSAGDDLGAGVRKARRVLVEVLAAAGVDDVASARSRHEQRRLAEGELGLLRRQLAEELGADEVGALRRRARALGERVGNGASGGADFGDAASIGTELGDAASVGAEPDAEELRARARVAHQAHAAARATRDAADAARAGCREQLSAQQLEHARQQAALQAAVGELADVRDRLAAERADLPDAELAARVDRAGELAATAAVQERLVLRRLEEADPDSLRPLLDNARAVTDRLEADLAARQQELAGVAARLEVVGGLGRQQQLDDARTALAAAESQASRIEARARAARLLRDTLLSHREASRRQYVEPYRAQVTRLGRIVFGPDFTVDVDNELRIVSRTRAGTTVPFDALSSGAKEQLGIIARLACAAIVHEDDGVPVLVDDALGYSDPERLRRVGAVLSVAASSAQVIVLTCTPERYRSVGSAHVISLDDACA
jgi:hypothetical protein